MTSVQITPVAAASDSSGPSGAAGTARAEAGAKWRDVIAAAHPHGLAPLNGFAGTVGVSGYMLGGGIGWLVRRYGAAAGSLRSAELVTADGRLLQVNDQNHADLFWGLRGGGGNFGIVTSLEFDLYPVKEIFGGFVVYPLAHGKQALSAYAQWTKTVPDTLTSAVRLVHFPPAPAIPEPLRGASAVVIMACYTGSTAEGEALLKPLRSIGTPLLDTFRPMPYAEIATIANDPPEAPPLFTFANGGGLRDLSSDVIDALLRIAGDRAAGIFMVEARHAGGALARQPEDAMPFGFRSPWFISALAAAPTPQALEGANVGRRAARGAETRTDRRGADQQPRRRQHGPRTLRAPGIQRRTIEGSSRSRTNTIRRTSSASITTSRLPKVAGRCRPRRPHHRRPTVEQLRDFLLVRCEPLELLARRPANPTATRRRCHPVCTRSVQASRSVCRRAQLLPESATNRRGRFPWASTWRPIRRSAALL